MPTYDYTCDICGHRFEHYQRMTAPLLSKCPRCGKRGLRRLIGTGGGIIFKGSGFYQTDYRSESYKQAAEAEKAATSAGGDGKATDMKSTAGAAPAAEPKKTTKRASGACKVGQGRKE